MLHTYDLRCCFDYPTKISWKSMWNRSGDMPSDQAWYNSSGILKAYIEAKHKESRVTIMMAEVTKDVFMNFEWISTQAFGFNNGVKALGVPQTIGLSIVTPDVRISVYVDGQIKIVNREDKELIQQIWKV